MKNLFDLTGKVVAITGGAGGTAGSRQNFSKRRSQN